MSESQGRILVCVSAEAVRFRVEGRGLAVHCPAMRAFAERSLDGRVRHVWIELEACEYCDSTFMGTLLRLQGAAARAGDGELQLVGPSDEARTVLKRMGLHRLFEVRDESAPPGDWQPLEDPTPSTRAFKENVVEAHRQLADSSDDLGAIYGEIAEQAARELENETGG